MSKLITILRTNMRVGYELNFNDVLRACVTLFYLISRMSFQRRRFSILPCLGDTCSKQSRAAGYRVIRHALVDRERVSSLGDALDWYIVKYVIPLNMQHGQTGFPGLYSVIISMQSRKNKWPS